jgi:hypothetical protein
MKKNIFLFGINVLFIALFSLSILLTSNYFIIGFTLILLLGTGVFTAITIQRLRSFQGKKGFTTQSYSFSNNLESIQPGIVVNKHLYL